MTGTGLASSAGLNAYVPLLAIGVMDRYTGLTTLPEGWDWLGSRWAIGILAVLLVIEVVADKIPMVDSLNDVLQTAVRPTAGGLAFGAGTSSETALVVNDQSLAFSDSQWTPIAIGVVIALVVHILKALVRPVINTVTGCMGGPIVSTIEDLGSMAMALVAIVVPFLVIFFIIGLVMFFWWGLRRRARRRRANPATAG